MGNGVQKGVVTCDAVGSRTNHDCALPFRT
jgi:hypothetical protein